MKERRLDMPWPKVAIAKALRIAPSSIVDLVAAGKLLPVIRPGRKRQLYYLNDVLEAFKACRRPLEIATPKPVRRAPVRTTESKIRYRPGFDELVKLARRSRKPAPSPRDD